MTDTDKEQELYEKFQELNENIAKRQKSLHSFIDGSPKAARTEKYEAFKEKRQNEIDNLIDERTEILEALHKFWVPSDD